MDIQELTVEIREEIGKNKVKQLRKNGMIPSVIYGEELEPVSIKLDHKSLLSIYKSKSGKNSIIKMSYSKNKKQITQNVISHDITFNAISDKLEHVDFMAINMKKRIHTFVPIHFIGEAVGVKMGGLLLHNMDKIEIECLPNLIPDFISVDISSINLGQSVRIKNLQLDEGISVLNPMDEIIVHVESQKSSTEEEEATDMSGSTATSEKAETASE